MARWVLFGVFLIGLLAIGQAAESSIPHRRILKKSASANATSTSVSTGDGGKASSSSSATSTGGKTVASSVADTQIFEDTEIEIKEMWSKFQNIVLEESSCDEVTAAAETAVNERLEALAEVYSGAFGTVSINGTGSGCVSAESEGEAFASAYLQAIVDVIAEIKFEGEDEDEAFARAYGELMAGATAKAWARALIDGCVSVSNDEGHLLAEQESFAKATAAPAIVAFAWAEVSAECGKQAFSFVDIEGSISVEEDTQATTTSKTEIKGSGNVNADGDAEAGTAEVTDPKELVDIRIAEADTCSFEYAFCCFTSPSEICRCTMSTNEKRFRCKAEASEGTDKILWVDVETKEECYCSK